MLIIRIVRFSLNQLSANSHQKNRHSGLVPESIEPLARTDKWIPASAGMTKLCQLVTENWHEDCQIHLVFQHIAKFLALA